MKKYRCTKCGRPHTHGILGQSAIEFFTAYPGFGFQNPLNSVFWELILKDQRRHMTLNLLS